MKTSLYIIFFNFTSIFLLTVSNPDILYTSSPYNQTRTSLKLKIFNALAFDIPTDQKYGFGIAQIHSFSKKTVISYNQFQRYGEKHRGVHSGLLKLLQTTDQSITIYEEESNNQDQIKYATFSLQNAPIPGACCQTCALETDPNIKLKYDEIKTEITFHRASRTYPLDGIPACDNVETPSTYLLTYDVYYYYIESNDFSKESLFDAIKLMSTPELIRQNAMKLTTLGGVDKLSLSTETIFGQGVIFNVIVYDTVNEISSAYVPTATYACNITNTLSEECLQKGSTTTFVFCVIYAAVGIIICFFGFKLYRVLVFISGSLFFWIITYSLIARYLANSQDTDELLIISSLCALVGGGFILFLYGFDKFKYFCLLVICIVFGMAIASIAFFTPFGYLSVWNEDYQFILGFACVTLGVAAMFLFFPKTVCYLHSSIIGSYGVILLPNYFLRANMQYIIVTVLLRMTISDFGSSYLRRPYQQNEYILTGVWGGLFILGFIVQYFTTKKDDFEISGREVRQKAWLTVSQKFSKSKVKRKKLKDKQYYTPPSINASERTPLLIEQNNDLNTQPKGGFATFKPYGIDNPGSDFEHQPLLHAQQQPTAPVMENEDRIFITQ